MAGPRKKPALETPMEENSSESEIEEESESGDVSGFDETFQADFEGRNPEQNDYHGICRLLKQLFLKSHVNIPQLSDMIIAQQGIGSVLKNAPDEDDLEDDDCSYDSSEGDVFGVTTVINLTSNQETESVQQILEILKNVSARYADKSTTKLFEKILTHKKKLGLLLNERFINIPAKIADPMLRSLQSEIDRMAVKNSDYNFDYYLMICKTYKAKDQKNAETQYTNAEEEIFCKSCDAYFEFSVADESDTGVDGSWTEGDSVYIPLRRILIFNANKFDEIIKTVKIFVS